ncbi:DUF427 domain-containing protein [Paractinoplanes brasiliensis]|uniref:Uncharacterized protein (DUF427 family) n=1 Tax=Paractinoplanes brasiliensis TaxID=52695 RepID=A0A4R6JR25_9ACTN|nr:DUF427 domain-containing protein [Actinoplanes brasiliensis]TDO37841.1 uncharacterized protein (DUF427 family) [Actinoplanes brasiliensis]GID33020.1 hypothetical protein Abr02nite_80030 [Actinoplanes brasiliensis]
MSEFEPPAPVVERTPRRVRVRLGGTVVADSSRAWLLDEISERGFPTYFVPFEDVRDDALEEGTAGRWTVVAAGRRAADAAWTDDRFEQLNGHVTFSWESLDWYEEDEQVFVHARSPRHRVDAVRSSRRVQVFVGGDEVANSTRPVIVFETSLPTRYYLPFADVRSELLTASETVTRCPYKGVARYWSHPALADAAWSYPEPIPEMPKIRDLVCFFNERVDIVLDGVPLERPVSPFS